MCWETIKKKKKKVIDEPGEKKMGLGDTHLMAAEGHWWVCLREIETGPQYSPLRSPEQCENQQKVERSRPILTGAFTLRLLISLCQASICLA